MVQAQFYFDFGSPNAYLAHRVLPALEARTGVPLEYVPMLLGGVFKATGNESPAFKYAPIRNKLPYEQLEITRFLAKHSITDFVFNPFFPVNTLTLMRGAVAAQSLGVLPRYVDEVFRHMWSAPKKMDDPAVLASALTESGLDAKAILDLAATPEIKARLIANTEGAVERGAFGAPTFFVNGEMWFGKDRLKDVEEAIDAAKG